MKRDFSYILKEVAKYSCSALFSNTCYHLPVRGIPILLYHSIDETQSPISISPDEFRRHMAFLKKLYIKIVSLRDLVQEYLLNDGRSTKKAVITFDDGYENNYTYAFPILKEFGFTATFFITTETVGKIPTWLKEYIDSISPYSPKIKDPRKLKLNLELFSQINPPRLFYTEHDILKRLRGFELLSSQRMMSWQQIKEMSNHGMDFGSHTLTHPFLTSLKTQELTEEIKGSKAIIEEELGKPVQFFSYPYGIFSGAIVEAVKEAGFLGACSADLGVSNPHTERYLLRRVGVRSSFDLKLYSSRGLNWYLGLRQRMRAASCPTG